uniref:Uncharacterized protein MANES_04G052500 n=1 Tax=Rhizophora mucronata TaxID=61149 RepID=A0A2P2JPU3_RHIMU
MKKRKTHIKKVKILLTLRTNLMTLLQILWFEALKILIEYMIKLYRVVHLPCLLQLQKLSY